MKPAFLLLFAVAALALAGTATGSGPPVINDTTVGKDMTDTYLDVSPCTEDPAVWTSVGHAMFHLTVFADETVHARVTFTSTFVVDTIDPSKPDFSGHSEDGFSFNGDDGTAEATSTFTPILKGTDGSKLKFHYTSHMTVNANGEVTVEFDKSQSNVSCV